MLFSSQDYLRTGTRDLDHPVLAGAKTPLVDTPGRRIWSVLFLWMFQWYHHLQSSLAPTVNV
jgi:hypothetical protein